MLRICYANVSDLAVCQRCPALFGYKVHCQEKNAWLEGIKGKSSCYYGSMFHKNIAQVFFMAAADSRNPLHAGLGRAVAEGREALEEFIRENIFMPFVEEYSDKYTPGQIMAAAEGVRVWVNAMHEFFREIPSLMRNPLRNMHTVFPAPEQKLQSYYDFRGEGRLVVTGRYDALMFNPDRSEARLFEFKGYSKSDAVVPLSQSVMYAWLIERFSGIVPSVEIIYLDEENRKPDVFSQASVRSMITSGLPGLFYTAFNTIRLRRLPAMVKDKDFCGECRFRNDCITDWEDKFQNKKSNKSKKKGASIINVIVFMAAAVMMITHVFFFSALSSENRKLQAETLQQRFRFDRALNDAIEIIGDDNLTMNEISPDVNKYTDFRDKTRIYHQLYDDIDVYMSIYDLKYKLDGFTSNISGYVKAIKLVDDYSTSENADAIIPFRMFSPMVSEAGKRYFLVRVCGTEDIYKDRLKSDNKREMMYQVLVCRYTTPPSGHKRVEVLSFQEVWY